MPDLKLGHTGYYSQDACDLADFVDLASQNLTSDAVPFANTIEKNIPIYGGASLDAALSDPERCKALMAEWAHVLQHSAGALVIKGAYKDTQYIDQASEIYNQIIADEKAANATAADHFATAGNNDRVWNSLQKLCQASPLVFAHYFSNVPIAKVCEAWLGPNYQMTAQINLVRPGGQAQQAHRDYHLGFQTAQRSAQYPAHVHELTPALTLQGAIAHCDMPIDSGPTKLLPFSQTYLAGYAAWRRDDFREYFENNYVQLPLEKGDALFFSPALFHGAGSNVSQSTERMANLIQVSSAFGRAMETIDRAKMCELLYPVVREMHLNGDLSGAELDAVIASSGEGYSFPTNLDTDPPVGGLAPETQQELFKRALANGFEPAKFNEALRNLEMRKIS